MENCTNFYDNLKLPRNWALNQRPSLARLEWLKSQKLKDLIPRFIEWLFKPVCVSQALVESRQTEQSQGRAKKDLLAVPIF